MESVVQTTVGTRSRRARGVVSFTVAVKLADGSFSVVQTDCAESVAIRTLVRQNGGMEERGPQKIAYARVSTNEQDTALQLAALKAWGADIIFEEKMTGTKDRRPALDAMLAYAQPGDTIGCYKLDRMGRKTVALIQLVTDLNKRGIAFTSLTQGFDTGTPFGVAMLGMLAVFAQFERDMIQERVQAGIDAAKERGQFNGTKRSLTGKRLEQARAMYADRPLNPLTGKPYTVGQLAQHFGVDRTTFLRWAQPDYFERSTNKDAQRFRQRHADLDEWLAASNDPSYGRPVRSVSRGG